MNVFAIDPGNTQSGYCIIDSETYKPLEIGKVANEELRYILLTKYYAKKNIKFVIEEIQSYGMAVGKTVFETCEWTGRFIECVDGHMAKLKRKDVKMHLCGKTSVKDKDIIQAMVTRFTPNAKNYGKGTKTNPEWFYGFKSDIWQAYALGVTYIDKELK